MNRKERVKRVIQHQQTDLVPYNIDYTPPVQRLLQRHFGQEDVDEAIGNHILLAEGKGPRPGGRLHFGAQHQSPERCAS